MDATTAPRPPRRQRSDGARSREAILREAARLATVDGIEGLSIARLADAVGMSKSGLFAHFGSKEELQLATVEAAAEVFGATVVEPAVAAGTGATRIRALCERFLAHLEDGIFPGGCFFASVSAELDTHPGAVRDRAAAVVGEWFSLLEAAVRDGQAAGELDPREDPAQLTFELHAFLLLANGMYVESGDTAALDRARRAVDARLAAAAPRAA